MLPHEPGGLGLLLPLDSSSDPFTSLNISDFSELSPHSRGVRESHGYQEVPPEDPPLG